MFCSPDGAPLCSVAYIGGQRCIVVVLHLLIIKQETKHPIYCVSARLLSYRKAIHVNSVFMAFHGNPAQPI